MPPSPPPENLPPTPPADRPTEATAGERDRPRTRAWARLLAPLVPLAVVLAVLVVLLVHGSGGTTSQPVAGRPGPASSAYNALLAKPAKPAPPLELHDYLGRPVNIASFRGKAVLVSFLYTHCPDVCPLTTSNLRLAQSRLGEKAARVQIIAVSVDPRGDTRAAIGAFLAGHGMVGRMLYLTGSRAELRRTWAAWGIAIKQGAGTQVAHEALVYGITASGTLTTIYPSSFDPAQIVHDVPVLAAH